MATRQHVKLSANVSIPLQGLDLAPFASESATLEADGAIYDLYALANHSGSADSGHYTAHAKVCAADDSQPWCLFADDRVQEVRRYTRWFLISDGCCDIVWSARLRTYLGFGFGFPMHAWLQRWLGVSRLRWVCTGGQSWDSACSRTEYVDVPEFTVYLPILALVVLCELPLNAPIVGKRCFLRVYVNECDAAWDAYWGKLRLQVAADDVVSSEAYMCFYVHRPPVPVPAEAPNAMKQ